MRILTLFTIITLIIGALVANRCSAKSTTKQTLPEDFDKTVNSRNFPRQTPFHKSRRGFTTKDYNIVQNEKSSNENFPSPKNTFPPHQQQQERGENRQRTASTTENAESELINIFFMHRHGARTSAIVRNGVPDWNGCVLSAQGQLMAKSLGQYLTARYNGTSANNFADKTLQYFPPNYDTVKVNSWTTDFERTIRTGAAVLQGMFTTQEQTAFGKPSIAPYMQHLPQDMDFMLSYWYSWPSALLHANEVNGWYITTNPFTQSIFSPADFDLLGRFLNATELCQTKPTTCAIVAEDFVTCELSNREPTSVPLLLEVANKTLDRLFLMYHKNLLFNYFSNSSDPYWQGVGFYASEVIRDMMGKIRIALQSTPDQLMNDPTTSVVHHYSAHDVTVYGLLVALGVAEADTTLVDINAPTFTATTLFELYRNGTLRFYYVLCNQSYGSDHAFKAQEGNIFRMNCMRQNTTPDERPQDLMYKAHACPFEDVERAVNYTIATLFPKTSPVLEETMCYADPDDVRENSCAASSKRGTANCQAYRTFCPTVACSPTWINSERFAKFTPSGLVREDTETNDGNDVLAGHSEMVSNQIGTGNYTRDLSYEKYVFNATNAGGSASSVYECVEIVPFPNDRWAETLKSDASRAYVFLCSMGLGIVLGVVFAACYVRRRELTKGGLKRNQKGHREYVKFFEQGGDSGVVDPKNHTNNEDGSTLKTRSAFGGSEVVRRGYADV